jgi:large subunit ribosomal protein L24
MSSTNKMKIKKGDEVIVVSGRDKGKKGNVLSVNPAARRVLVQGVNMVKKHNRASAAGAGGIEEKELSIDVSNISLIDPKLGKATRVGYKTIEGGQKVRFARSSGEIID